MTYYHCNPQPYESGEIIFEIQTWSAPDDTMRLNLSGSGTLFVYRGALDTDSLITYCEGIACIEQVLRGQIFYVVMDWPFQWSLDYSLTVQCLPAFTQGDVCEDPIAVTGSGTTTFCTAGYHNDYTFGTGSCVGPPGNGADVIYELCLGPGSTIQVEMLEACAQYAAMYLFTDCANPVGSCVAWGADLIPPPSSFLISWANGSSEARRIYLAVDNLCSDQIDFGYSGTLRFNYTPCPQGGACCLPTGQCLFLTPMACAGQSGLYQGDYTSCTPNPCPPWGACCLPTGQCQLWFQAPCEAAGGTFRVGLLCSPNPCLGACCLPDGTCQLAPPGPCVSGGGSFHGFVACTPNPCPPSSAPQVPLPAGGMAISAVPNPTRAGTLLRFRLSWEAEARLAVFDAAGRQVRLLLHDRQPAGLRELSWDGRDAGGSPVPAGTYYCRLQSREQEASCPIVILP